MFQKYFENLAKAEDHKSHELSFSATFLTFGLKTRGFSPKLLKYGVDFGRI